MEAEPLGLFGLGAVDVPQPPGPDPPRRSELRDLFKEVDVCVEEEGQAGSEFVNVHPARAAQLDVREPIGQRERKLLRSRRPRLTDVIARDRDRLVLRHLGGAPLHQVTNEPKVRLGRE